MKNKLVLGFNKNISNEDYHAERNYLSSSGLKMLLDNPQEFKDKFVLGLWDNVENAAFSFGTYIHTAILEPHLLESTTAIWEGKRKFGKEYDKFKVDNKDKVILSAVELERANAIMENYKKMPLSQNIIKNGISEATFCGVIDGVPLKVRFDSIGKYGLDVKTTSFPITVESMENTIDKYDYALSAALYVEVAKLCGFPTDKFYFLFANKKSYDTVLIEANDNLIRYGKYQMKKALEKYKELKASGFLDISPRIKIVEEVFSESRNNSNDEKNEGND